MFLNYFFTKILKNKMLQLLVFICHPVINKLNANKFLLFNQQIKLKQFYFSCISVPLRIALYVVVSFNISIAFFISSSSKKEASILPF